MLRGARQVGKTTLIHEFGKQFRQYLYLNLDNPQHQALFKSTESAEENLRRVFFFFSAEWDLAHSLLFLDEIQALPWLTTQLRFFYEEHPSLRVIAAGSLLETLINRKISFPVGRVTYLYLYPVSFLEFLEYSTGKVEVELIHQIPLPDFSLDKYFKLFKVYFLIGGMPAVVKEFHANQDYVQLQKIFQDLYLAYQDDVEKYARNEPQIPVIRTAIKSIFVEAGRRIKFENFGNSHYRSREMSEAIKLLEKALLLHLIYPITSSRLPLKSDFKKRPRLQTLDIGLVNYLGGYIHALMQTDFVWSDGHLLEQVIGQEILANQPLNMDLNFWTREKNQSQAEVDFVIQYHDKLIPVELKSGASGRLKSLLLFMEECPHQLAIRLYYGPVKIDQLTTPLGKIFYLLNLPYFLIGKLPAYLGWFEGKIAKK